MSTGHPPALDSTLTHYRCTAVTVADTGTAAALLDEGKWPYTGEYALGAVGTRNAESHAVSVQEGTQRACIQTRSVPLPKHGALTSLCTA